jgi:tRNA G46 methylase TrmB
MVCNGSTFKQIADVLAVHGQLLLVTDSTGLHEAAKLGTVTIIQQVNYFLIARVDRRTHDDKLSGNL